MNAKTLVKQVHNVFSLPDIVIKLNELLNEPDPNISELEALFLDEPALTAKLLKFVNSSYFGFQNKIDTVSRAITMLGFVELRHLVMGVSVTAQFKSIPSDLVDMRTFWYHSIVVGLLTKILAKNLQSSSHERLYIAGLLSGIGKLIFFSKFPEEMVKILEMKDQAGLNGIDAEREIFGFDHAELGAELLKEWKLPAEIWQMVYYQYDPLHEKAPKMDACLLHVAGIISSTVQLCDNQIYNFEDYHPAFNPDVLAHLSLTPEMIQSATSEALLYPLEILNIIHH